MVDVHVVLNDIMELVAEGAERGNCTCSVFHHVTDNPHYRESMEHLLDTLDGILRFSADPEATVSNVAHFLTAVIALGYSLGASDAYDVTLLSDICMPDSLSEADFLAPEIGERPEND